MATPILMDSSKTWVPSKQELNRLPAAEMKFLIKAKGCTRRDRTSNEDIRTEVKSVI